MIDSTAQTLFIWLLTDPRTHLAPHPAAKPLEYWLAVHVRHMAVAHGQVVMQWAHVHCVACEISAEVSYGRLRGLA